MTKYIKKDHPDIGTSSLEETVDAIFSHLLNKAPCSVIAEMKPDEKSVIWHSSDNPRNVIFKCPSRQFRALLARIGHYYLNDQLHEGFGIINLGFEGDDKVFSARIYLANHSLTGYWIRIYVN